MLRRVARGEEFEDVLVALKKHGVTFEKEYVRRFVLQLPMRGRLP